MLMKCLPASLALLIAPACLWCQPAMPAWLAPYPGAIPSVQKLGAMVAANYDTAAAPDAVRDHYHELFDAEGITFAPTSNTFGTTIRAVTQCGDNPGDLSIMIHAKGAGSTIRISCSVKLAPAVLPRSTGNHQQDVAQMLEMHKQRVEELGIHRQREDAPAPPLVWPEWLVHVKNARLAIQKAVDQAGVSYLKARYVTSVPMSELFVYYKDLLTAQGYSINRGTVGTGQTLKGVKQNAHGEIESSIYPDGFPGPSIEIDVTFSRNYLNDPITVEMRFKPYAYKAPIAREP
jgi:hypothetical protein